MNKLSAQFSLGILLAIICLLPVRASLAAECKDLTQLSSDTVLLTAAEDRIRATAKLRSGLEVTLAPHCRIAATLKPNPESEIRIEIWMPPEWNGKFLAVGNGGWAGSIRPWSMVPGLAAGYAVASNDTGHKGGSGAFALISREKVIDFAWRAMHEMTVVSKEIIETYYQRPPRRSYYHGCSTGGREGMMEAQRSPADFDAIIVGGPVNNMLTMTATQMDTFVSFSEDRELALSPEKIELLHNAVLAACDKNDGVKDGILNDPIACEFEPRSMQCKRGSDTAECLTEGEASSVERAYAGVYGENGALLYPGFAKGFELGWRIPDEGSEPNTLQSDAIRYLGYEDANWDWREFELERDLALVLSKAGFVEALEPDLSEFKARGGKILFYHGWNDPGPSPFNTINYYNEVLATMGPDQGDWLRLFMMPGVGHCRGGIGPDQVDFVAAIDNWVENAMAPERIIASRVRDGETDMTRPLCPYPQVAVWDGVGDPDEAASFMCNAPLTPLSGT